ncbi:3-keto-5-aminohexanoate cleavage protein [Bradyrhizobium sp. CER78]|uniref:3-keto-5-aminohexanoate cleavage protein n=1 Tax=Bradyrhizobium sp. CER78 TaxID=3039162 RepID=UPI00244899B2|nr:3-keto-5-aminohexanoate cleavage protein [Bradyrhizobium sp. CER78]MDH2384485.1 3-keto-5-aminohexanoate cleavage protein [Bradyrhizobium sp. CER78]
MRPDFRSVDARQNGHQRSARSAALNQANPGRSANRPRTKTARIWCGGRAEGDGKPYQITLNEWSLELGGHCRTGLEDTVRLDREHLASSNAALVNRVVQLCRRYGRHPATVHEARALLKLAA